jgi:hypothetical protein
MSEHPTSGKKDLRIKALEKEIFAQKHAISALKEAYDIINKSPDVVFLLKHDEDWPVEFVSDNVRALLKWQEQFAMK